MPTSYRKWLSEIYDAKTVPIWLPISAIASGSAMIAGLSVWIATSALVSQSEANPSDTVFGIGLVAIAAALIIVPATFLPGMQFMRLFLLASFASLWVPPLVTIGGLNLRPSQLLIPSGLAIIARTKPLRQLSLPYVRYGLLAGILWLVYLFWTIVNLREPAAELGHVVLLGLNLLHYVITYVLMRDNVLRAREIMCWLAICIVAGTMWSLGSYLGSTSGFIDATYSERLPVISGGEVLVASIQRLNNGVLTGTFSAYMFVILLVVVALSGETQYRTMLLCGAISALVGVVLGLARAANLGLLIGTVMAILFSIKARGSWKVLLLGVALAFGAGSLLLALGAVFAEIDLLLGAFVGRWWLLLEGKAYVTGTASARLSAWFLMWQDIAMNPFWGQGADAFLRYFPFGSRASENVALEILHSAGLGGFVPYVFLIGFGLCMAMRRALLGIDTSLAHRQALIGLSAGFTGLLAASLTNPSGWAALFWVALGLMVGATDGRR